MLPENELTGPRLVVTLLEIALHKWVLLAARLGLATVATVVLMLLGYMVLKLNRLLTTYGQEMMWRTTLIRWQMTQGRRYILAQHKIRPS